MVTINELAADVFTITNRPDLVAETALAIKRAVRKLHSVDMFHQDLRSATVALVQSADFRYAVDTTALPITRFRKLRSVTKVSDGLPVPKRTADDIMDNRLGEYPEYCFIAGMLLNLKLLTEETSVVISYYQHPYVGAVTDPIVSWIADNHPEFIVDEAAADVFKAIGKDNEAQVYRTKLAEAVAILRMEGIESPD